MPYLSHVPREPDELVGIAEDARRLWSKVLRHYGRGRELVVDEELHAVRRTRC
jgi:hypothetical protein